MAPAEAEEADGVMQAKQWGWHLAWRERTRAKDSEAEWQSQILDLDRSGEEYALNKTKKRGRKGDRERERS